MDGRTILSSEGYLRSVADPNWLVIGAGDFNGDGRDDILWRNAQTGENYLYPLNGTTILPGEGYLRTVADQNWVMSRIGDFNGDGKADIFWRNVVTGQNYVYMMSGTSITNEGPVRAVAVETDWFLPLWP
jgi:uncharacterized protein YegP (UPF0339 family)